MSNWQSRAGGSFGTLNEVFLTQNLFQSFCFVGIRYFFQILTLFLFFSPFSLSLTLSIFLSLPSILSFSSLSLSSFDFCLEKNLFWCFLVCVTICFVVDPETPLPSVFAKNNMASSKRTRQSEEDRFHLRSSLPFQTIQSGGNDRSVQHTVFGWSRLHDYGIAVYRLVAMILRLSLYRDKMAGEVQSG